MNKLLLSGIILILLSSFANAEIIVNKYEAGYSLSANNISEKNCECSFIEDSYTIKNTAEITQAFSITNNLNLIQSANAVTLKPGQSAIIRIGAPLACKAKDFSYTLKTVSSLGEIKELTRNVKVTSCENLHLSLFPIEDINPNSTVNFTLQVTNIGPYQENYLVTSERLNEFTDEEAFIITIPAFSAQNVTFSYNFPPNFYGNKTAVFKARTEQSKLTSMVRQDFKIYRSYDFSLQTEEQTICTELDNKVKLNITNEGAIPNVYSFSIIGNADYTIENPNINLTPGQTAEVYVIPTKDKPTTEEVLVKAIALYGGIEAEIKIPVKVIDCYNLEITVPQKISQCEEDKDYDIVLNNKGILDDFVKLTIKGNATLNEQEITVEKNSTETVKLEIRPEENYNEILVLNITGSDGIYKVFNIPLKTVDEYECTKPTVYPTDFSTTKQQNEFKIRITNVGEKSAEYSLSIDNDAELNNYTLFLDAKKTKTILIQTDFSNREYADYSFVLTLDTKEQKYEELITISFKERSAFMKLIDFMNYNWCLWVMFGLIVSVLIAFLLWVFVPKKTSNTLPAKIVGIILLILLTGSFIALIVTIGKPAPLFPILESNESTLHYKKYAGEEITFNLNDYFIDLDNDTLTYEISGDKIPFNLTDKGIATMNLDEGYYLVYFIAFDGETETRSPPITIEVIKKPSVGIIQTILSYCPWINWALLLIFSLFLFATLLKYGGKKRTKEGTKPAKKTAKKTKTSKKK